MTPRPEQVSVKLSLREKAALQNYAGFLGISMSQYMREWTLPEIPPEYWEREPTPPGQLSLVEDES